MSNRVLAESNHGGRSGRRVLVPAIDDSSLELDLIRLERRGRLLLTDAGGSADLLLYAFAGAGSLSVEDETHELPADAAALVPAGERAALEAGPDGLAAICAAVGPDVDLHAPLGRRDIVARAQDADSARATGSRPFEILLGPGNGSARTTLFVGHVPPGRAPWHFHLYDELVWIADGPGRLHLDGGVEEIPTGSAFRLRPREVHIVENARAEGDLTLVGIFTPAGSPSAAYLTSDVAAEYRFSG
jgi:quercetin dioxygenase-like cupin family protein